MLLLTIISWIVSIALKLFFFLVLLLVALILGYRFFYEPVKGVCVCKRDLKGRTVVVTGGNSGIGLETARDLAKRGAKVIIACRDVKKSEDAVTDIINSTQNSKVKFKQLDLSKFESIRRFAKDFNETEERLDILVNNAGCAGVKKKPTEDGIDTVMQVNYFGPFLLTNLLLDKLKASSPSRIVIVSSYAHVMARLNVEDLKGLKTKGYWTRYANSKLCNVLWAKALAKHLTNGVTANVLHPGVVKTDIFKRLPDVYRDIVLKIITLVFKTAKEGAQTTIHLCVAPELVNATGGYYRDCKPEKVSSVVTDELVDKVWKESLKIIQN
ncbi:retinol dehydrogenase 12 [Plutella xylostella]|uniref:retinol dehydrogenase 12 n=1 Tax=Plutella xylostella TaxID=51655 RepID=UPI0020326B23|nr:retinol dehydrogenase 12 [Plutella xylostella]